MVGKGNQMSGNPKQSFRGITRAGFARLRQKATKGGIHVSSPIGEAVKDGVRIQWNYDAASEVLEVECRAPFWINSSRINADLRHEIEAALGSNRAA
jgi:hypothetical protein